MSSSDARLMNILLSPHVSEKATVVAGNHNQYVFKVAKNADKAEIKAAVEKLFEVTVAGVQVVMLRVKGSGLERRWVAGKTGGKPTSLCRKARK